MKIYLSGAMSDDPDHKPKFDSAAADLRAQGHEVVSPAELDAVEGLNVAGITAGSPEWASLLSRDLAVILDPSIEAVVVLPDWATSRGARLEVHVAAELGKRILRYPDLGPARHPGSDRFHEVLRGLGMLHDRKQQDYGRDDDPFANVRGSAEWGVDDWVGAMIRASDKVRRLQTFARRGTLANEGVVDAFADLAVYAVIAQVLFEESADA